MLGCPQEMTNLGYVSYMHHVQNEDLGMPVRRSREYLILASHTMISAQQLETYIQTTFKMLCVSSPFSLDHFLLPDDHKLASSSNTGWRKVLFHQARSLMLCECLCVRTHDAMDKVLGELAVLAPSNQGSPSGSHVPPAEEADVDVEPDVPSAKKRRTKGGPVPKRTCKGANKGEKGDGGPLWRRDAIRAETSASVFAGSDGGVTDQFHASPWYALLSERERTNLRLRQARIVWAFCILHVSHTFEHGLCTKLVWCPRLPGGGSHPGSAQPW